MQWGLPRVDDRWRNASRGPTLAVATLLVAIAPFIPSAWTGLGTATFLGLVAGCVAPHAALHASGRMGALASVAPLVVPIVLAVGVLANDRAYSLVSMGPYLYVPLAASIWRSSGLIALAFGLGGALVAAVELTLGCVGTPTAALIANVLLPPVLYVFLSGEEERGRVLREANTQLRLAAARRRADARRLALAREVHDGLGAHLSAAVVHAEVVARAATLDPSRARAAAVRLRARLNDALQELDELLQPAPDLDWGALGTRLRDAVEKLATLGTRIDVTVSERGPIIAGPIATTLRRIAQEGVANALKHARATRVSVDLAVHDGAVRLVVEDDGRGLADAKPGFGRRGIAARVALTGGRIEWVSAPDVGTRLHVTLPLAEPREEAA